MNKINPYTGKAYSFHGYNCWDHVTAVRRDNDLTTQYFDCGCINQAYRIIADELRKDCAGLKKVKKPKDFDVALFAKLYKGATIYHCGIFYKDYISHAYARTRQVTLDKLKDIKNDFDTVTFWR